MLNAGTYTNTFYLSQFPNNIMMAVIDVIILKIGGVFSSNYLNIITVASAVSVAISIVLGFYIVKKVFSRKKALLFLIISIFTTPFYLYAAEYYTDTFSMPIALSLFYLYLIIKDTTKIKKIIYKMLFAIILFVGIKLKITSVFIVIAIIIYELLRKNLKKLIKSGVIIIPIVSVLIILFNGIVIKKLAPDELRYINEIPTEHWIMMGMNGVGKFSDEEYMYTNSNRTYPEKKQAAKNKIMERLKERTINQHIKNLTLKLGFAWHDGTYWAPEVLRREPVERKTLHEFVLEGGKYQLYYKYIPEIMHFAMLIFILFNIKRIKENEDYDSKDIISLITMLGIIIFLLIWENRSRYILNLVPLLIINQINGIEYVSEKYFRRKHKTIEGKDNNEKDISCNTNVL